MASVFDRLKAVAAGAYNQLKWGDKKTYATTMKQREDEERRKREAALKAAQNRARIQAAANRAAAAGVQQRKLTVEAPKSNNLQIKTNVAQPNQQIVVPKTTPNPASVDLSAGTVAARPKKDTRSAMQKLKDQISFGDDKTWQNNQQKTQKRTAAETLGDQFEANSPQDIAKRKAAGQPATYEEQEAQSFVRRNLTPKGLAKNAGNLAQEFARIVPTVALSGVDAIRDNGSQRRQLADLRSMSYEERKRLIDDMQKNAGGQLPSALRNSKVWQNPTDDVIDAAIAEAEGKKQKGTYTPGSRVEKFLFDPKDVETYQKRREGVEVALQEDYGLSQPNAATLSTLGIAGIAVSDVFPGGSAKSKLAKDVVKVSNADEVLKLLAKKGLHEVADQASIDKLANSKSKREVAAELDRLAKLRSDAAADLKRRVVQETAASSNLQKSAAREADEVLQDQGISLAENRVASAADEPDVRLTNDIDVDVPRPAETVDERALRVSREMLNTDTTPPAAIRPPEINVRLDDDLVREGFVTPEIENLATKYLRLGSDTTGDLDRAAVERYKADILSGRPIEPVIVDEMDFVQDGKHRLQALRELNIENVPTVRQVPRERRQSVGEAITTGLRPGEEVISIADNTADNFAQRAIDVSRGAARQTAQQNAPASAGAFAGFVPETDEEGNTTFNFDVKAAAAGILLLAGASNPKLRAYIASQAKNGKEALRAAVRESPEARAEVRKIIETMKTGDSMGLPVKINGVVDQPARYSDDVEEFIEQVLQTYPDIEIPRGLPEEQLTSRLDDAMLQIDEGLDALPSAELVDDTPLNVVTDPPAMNPIDEVVSAQSTADTAAAQMSRFGNEPITAQQAKAGAQQMKDEIIDAEAEMVLDQAGLRSAETSGFLSAIRQLGGISGTYDSALPLSIRRKTGSTADEIVAELNGLGYQIEDEAELLEKLDDIYRSGVSAKIGKKQAREIALENLEAGKSQFSPEYKQIDDVTNERIGKLVSNTKLAKDLMNSVDTKFNGKIERSFINTVKGAEGLSDEVAGTIGGSYNRVTNEEAVKFAKKYVKDVLNNPEQSIDELENFVRTERNSRGMAVAQQLVKHYQGTRQFEQAGRLVEETAQRLTEAGQEIQAARLFRELTPEAITQNLASKINRLKNDYPKQKRLQKLQITPAFQKELGEKMAEIKKMPDGEAKDLQTWALQELVRRQIPSTFADKVTSLYKANLLTAVTTTFGAVMGNTARGGLKLTTDALAAALDIGKSTLTGRERTRAFTARGLLDGTKEGIKRSQTFLKTGYDPRNPLNKFDQRRVFFSDTKRGKIAETYVNAVFRTMGAMDQPFYYAAFRNDLYEQAIVNGRNNKLRGKEFKKFVSEFVDAPPEDALEIANRRAREAVFQQDTALGNATAAFKRGLANGTGGEYSGSGQVGQIIGEGIVPFTKIPAAVAMTAIDFSPAGLGREIMTQIYNKNFDEERLIEAIAKSAVGTGGVMGTGAMLEENGLITLGYPSDAAEQDLWELEGKQEYSIKLGDKWRSLNYVQPFGALLAAGAAYQREDGGIVDKTTASARAVGSSVLEQSFLEGLSSAIDVVKDTTDERDDAINPAFKYLNRQVGSIIPNIIRRLATATDPTGGRIADNPIENIMLGIPGLRNELTPARNILGEEKRKRASGLEIFFDPTKPSTANDQNEVINELRRLEDAEQGILPTEFKGKEKVAGNEISLTTDQADTMMSSINPKIRDAWAQIVKMPEYAAANDEEKRKMLEGARDDFNATGKITFAENQGLPVAQEQYDKLTDDQQRLKLGGEYSANAVLGLPEGISQASRDSLLNYKKLSDSERDKWLAEGDNEYQYELARFEEKDLRGDYTNPQKFEKLIELGKLKVQTGYSKEARDLYKLSKRELEAFLNEYPTQQSVLDEMYAMDNALADAGFISKPKFGSGSGSGGGGRGGKAKTVKVPLPQFGNFGLVGDAPSPDAATMTLEEVLRDYAAKIGGISVLQMRLAPESQSEVQFEL